MTNTKRVCAGSPGSSKKSLEGSENSHPASRSGSSKSGKMISSDIMKIDEFNSVNCKFSTQLHKTVSFNNDLQIRTELTNTNTTNSMSKLDEKSCRSDATFTPLTDNSYETPLAPEKLPHSNSHSLENLSDFNSNLMRSHHSRQTAEEACSSSRGSSKDTPLPQRKSLLDNVRLLFRA